jgi:hypothetical protein
MSQWIGTSGALASAIAGNPAPKAVGVVRTHTYNDIVTIHQGNNAQPGALYYDCDNNVYYFGQLDGSLLTSQGTAPPINQTPNGYKDFRFDGLAGLTLEMTTGTTLGHDTSRGLFVETGTSGFDDGVKFRGAFDFARSSGVTLDWVFSTQAGSQIMLGFMRQAADVNALTTTGYYQQEAGIYIPGTFSTTAYGRNQGTGANAIESLGGTANYAAGNFYRVRMPIGNPSGFSANLKIEAVDPTDWDSVITTFIDRNMTVVGGLEALCCPSFVYGAVGPFWLAGLRVA